MQPLITTILQDLQVDFANSMELLKPVAIQLLLWFFMYELCVNLLLAKAGSNPLIILKDKIKIWAILYAIIYYFQDIMDLIYKLFMYFVKVATGQQPKKLYELPFDVLSTSWTALKNITEGIELYSPSTWILLAGLIIGLIIFAKIAITIGLIVIEYMVMTTLCIVLVPFMMFEKLRFVGDKVIATLINLNMKIFVIQYLLFYFLKFLKKDINLQENDEVIMNSFYWLVAMALLGTFLMKGNEVVQTLISGSTSFGNASEVTNLGASAKAGAGNTAGAVKGVVAGGEYTKGGIGGAIKGAKKGGLKGIPGGAWQGLKRTRQNRIRRAKGLDPIKDEGEEDKE